MNAPRDFFGAWLSSIVDALCLGKLGADREDAATVVSEYESQLREIREHLAHGEVDLWLLLARTVDGDLVLYTGPLAHVMGAIRRHDVFRITLIPLAVCVERVRMLVEKGELEIDDALPPGRFTPEPPRRPN